MDNKIKLHLGGEERTLDFGKNAILRHLGDVTKAEGDFNLLDNGIWRDPGKSWKASFCFVYAGLLCAGMKNLERERVMEWVDELPLDKLDEIKFAGYAAISQKSIDDVKNIMAQAEKIAIQKNGTTAVEKIL